MREFPRYPLICAPTPEHRLNRLSDDLGIDLWIKRDDLTGFAMGGNKGRKLEFLLPQILEAQATTVVTCGSRQSNFIRQLGAACRIAGIKCVALVMDLPYEPPAAPPKSDVGHEGGNARLGEIFGIEIHHLPNGSWDDLFKAAAEMAQVLRAAGKAVFEIPVGGSSVPGAYSFWQAAHELRETYNQIIAASSSGSTQVGLASAFRGSATRVIGIACDPEPELPHEFAELAHHLDGREWTAADFEFDLHYVGPGYGVPSQAGQEALDAMAMREGILLDPIYSAKAFSALMDLAGQGRLPGRTLFWHTGGLPALFTY